MQSCIYEGKVTHCRHSPVSHRFEYRLFMVYLDLSELPSLVGRDRLIRQSKYAIRSLWRGDHLFDSLQSLESEVRQIVEAETGARPSGPIRMLTQLRYFGYYFSPLNLFYVFDESGTQLESIVAEVSNTPWKERHCYVLWDGNRCSSGAELRFSHRKEFHVSPFMAMDMQYQWRLTAPGETSTIALTNHEKSRSVFEAVMTLRRRDLTQTELRRMTWRYFLMTARIGAAIYYQALILWWKKCPFYPHPDKLTSPTSPVSKTRNASDMPPSEIG
ncbi:DUF1365 domain-containing protein [Novipirellula artificiosorum]|uniref:DUF1365 domain-containing protein n=1 Tax=Novipirellula artificiosorum TaxID=2528016 RepID=A0A5C6DW03_9BACT|nr:DUF1365 domain-containing protein [Novipirellula artificiosorum]TWU40910.1 hypothetical protein Poly41_17450 [Novipirellula artificiosorum]